MTYISPNSGKRYRPRDIERLADRAEKLKKDIEIQKSMTVIYRSAFERLLYHIVSFKVKGDKEMIKSNMKVLREIYLDS